MVAIWNTFILYRFHQVSMVSPSFNGFTHYLYTTESSLYLENQSILIPPKTFNSYEPGVTSIVLYNLIHYTYFQTISLHYHYRYLIHLL
jgi:hypothetical protein